MTQGKSSAASKWGDDDNDELPEAHETTVDSKGFKVRTEYKQNDLKQKIKITTRIRVIEEVCTLVLLRLDVHDIDAAAKRLQTKRTAIVVKERRSRLVKFGNAVGVADESNVTITDFSEVDAIHFK
jgi:hypothetical protein